MKTQKSLIDSDIANIRNDITQITNEINGTSGYWHGEAATKQRNDYNDSLAKINAMIDRLVTYPDRLFQMAGIYETTEEANTQVASTLKTDIQMV